MPKQTDTPKYIGAIGEAPDFHCPHIREIEHGDNSFPDIEVKMAETFAQECDEFLEYNDPPCEYISEIYVRSREVQKLVRAVDNVVAAREVAKRADTIELDDALLAVGAAINELAEARAALADIK